MSAFVRSGQMLSGELSDKTLTDPSKVMDSALTALFFFLLLFLFLTIFFLFVRHFCLAFGLFALIAAALLAFVLLATLRSVFTCFLFAGCARAAALLTGFGSTVGVHFGACLGGVTLHPTAVSIAGAG
ncbi:MAG: hypothetical protein K1564_05895 [Candidatus Thiodiazotropha sp. (ex. Lucinisca nassula)]|nr:hypothetical protein [Candidatus Thiodiazotropha sp. (ex. Lucinisca nassula)]